MNNLHLLEQQLQHYADLPNRISVGDQLHLDACASCRAKLAEYRLISAALKEMPVPAFDFNLDELVPQSAIPARKASLPWVAIAVALTGMVLMSLVLAVYSPNISSLAVNLSAVQLYLLSLPLAALCITQLVIQLIHHHRAMRKAVQEKIIFLQPIEGLPV